MHLVAEPAESPLAAALATALRRDSQVSLAETAEGADGILRVSGGKPSSRPAAIDQSGVATEYEVRLGADFRLLQRTPQGEEPVVARKGLEVRTTYPYQEGATSPAVEEANKRRAARQAANDLAERILSAIRQNF
ncbi:MAG TPA: LPS assembly lipoprotein LptE [Gammaproteobacteria bacterium]|nr:LPS assembly lipoprotein LptE [Gammaproteobacteria bacterium]